MLAFQIVFANQQLDDVEPATALGCKPGFEHMGRQTRGDRRRGWKSVHSSAVDGSCECAGSMKIKVISSVFHFHLACGNLANELCYHLIMLR